MNRRLTSVAIILALLICLTGCSGTAKMKADISEYGETPITISGLTDEEFTVTPNELAELDCVSRTATGATAKAGTVDAVGPLLNTFLAKYDVTIEDFDRIRFIASDEYKTVLKGEYLTDYEVVMAVASGSEPLSSDEQPLRILIPEAESNMWVYSVIKIEFVRE